MLSYNEKIGLRIKEARLEANLTLEELGDKVGLTKSTVTKYERGEIKTLDVGKIKEFANCLNVTSSYLAGWEDIDYTYNPSSNNDVLKVKETEESYGTYSYEEEKLIQNYRSLSPHDKDIVDYILEKSATKLDKVREDDYPYDYKVVNLYGDCRVSAGLGCTIFDNPSTETIKVPNTSEFRYADYAIYVCGNSMEPKYFDGDIVIVQLASSIDIGETGIFVIDGEGYIKKLGKNKLISFNKKYDPIKIDENTRCMGKVIGKI